MIAPSPAPVTTSPTTGGDQTVDSRRPPRAGDLVPVLPSVDEVPDQPAVSLGNGASPIESAPPLVAPENGGAPAPQTGLEETPDEEAASAGPELDGPAGEAGEELKGEKTEAEGAAAKKGAKAKKDGAAAPPEEGEAAAAAGGVPAQDPRFQQAQKKLKRSARRLKKHDPPAKKAGQAAAAALPPANEKLAGAKANQVVKMQTAPSKKPESKSFLIVLRAAIADVMPKKVSGTKHYMKGSDKAKLKGAVTGNINTQKEQATSGMKGASQAAPDTAKVAGKEVTALPDTKTPRPGGSVGAANAMPAPRTEEDVSLEGGKQDADQMMAANDLDQDQMQKANDPRFGAVVKTKSEADTYADTGPGEYRASEQETLAAAVAGSVAAERRGLMRLGAQRSAADKSIQGSQTGAKSKDELRRKEVTDKIEGIYKKTKDAVDKKLNSLEEDVTKIFDSGAETAINDMRDYVEDRFDDRYSGVSGKVLWGKDKIFALPSAVKRWFTEAHKVFITALDTLVVRIANLVEKRVKEATIEIDTGQKEIATYVNGLPKDLQNVGKAAEKEMKGRFSQLRRSVEDRKQALAEKLAHRYKDAHAKGAKALQDLKDKHKGLLERLRDAIMAVIEILRKFKERVMSMLKKGAATIRLIIKDPIGFLKNILNAIKKGLNQFIARIWEHLEAGFLKWLFGSLGDAGIQLPNDFSLASIFFLVLQVLGITYQRMRAKAVRLVGARNVTLVERVAGYIKTLIDGGPQALWEQIKEFIGNLKEMVINAIKAWLVTTIIKAAVFKLVSMFNPVGAIIQAITTIYNVVMFFIERINQIMEFVTAVMNSTHQIALGNIATAANWIEKALARAIPLMIAFLARLLSIGGITQKIKQIIKGIQGKIDKAIDKLIGKVIGLVKKAFGKGKGQAVAKEDSTGTVREQAGKMIARQIKGPINRKKIDQITASVLKSLRPQGLKRLDLKGAGEEDQLVVFAEASPYSELIKLIPRDTYQVAMVARIQLSGEEALEKGYPFAKQGPSHEKLEPIRTPLDPVGGPTAVPKGTWGLDREGQPKSAALLIPPDVGKPELFVVGWNTGFRKKDSNSSHAERQFVNWFEKRPREWKRRVTRIDLHVSWSPCDGCSGDLAKMTQDRSLTSLKEGEAYLSYDEVYPGTTAKGLNRMRPMWKVQGTQVPVKGDKNDEFEVELLKD